MSEEWRVLVDAWEGPLGGVPPFNRVTVEMFEPAIAYGIKALHREVNAIATNPATATFDNTILPLESAGAALSRALTVYGVWYGGLSTPAFRGVARRIEPTLAASSDALYQNSALYHRVQACCKDLSLDPTQKRLCEEYRHHFQSAGAGLNEEDRARVAAINLALSELYSRFGDNLLADEESQVVWLRKDQLRGLSKAFIAGAGAAAAALGQPGRWAVTNTRSSAEPFLEMSAERGLRQDVYLRFIGRGSAGDTDNKPIVEQILRYRQERAKLLGYKTHAHLRLANTMARDPERAQALMDRIWPAAKAKFAEELAEMQKLADYDAIRIEPWDVRFYAAKVRAKKFSLNSAEIAAHFQLEKLREGMFWAATELWGWTFHPLDVPTPHPDVRVWEIKNADGTIRGGFWFDPFARQGKRSGAWMSAYRVQNGITGEVPLVSNNCNFVRAPEGQPTLLTRDEARTLFHEFGHAMHGLSSDVPYPTLAGTNVPRDFVEFPSQLNEHWLTTEAMLKKFALHADTGEPLSAESLTKLNESAQANSGFRTVEFLGSALVDMAVHRRMEPIDVESFERDTLSALGMPAEIPMRHRIPHFAHIFSGESYSAAYYCYLWADALTADAAEHFEASGFYDPDRAKSYLSTVLSRGNTVDPAEAFVAFRGREVDVSALLRDRGLATT